MIKWDNSWNIDSGTIDYQHKKLIIIVNKILSGNNDIVESLKDLIDYTSFHFLDEQRVMTNSGYPKSLFEEHIKEHIKLKSSLLDYSFALTSYTLKHEEINIKEELIKFVEVWYINHFLQTDKKFADWLKEADSTK